MSLSAPTLGLLLRLIEEERIPKGRVLSLGVPELPSTDQFDYGAAGLPQYGKFDFRDLFDRLGFSDAVALDVSDYQTAEIVHDLNEPITDPALKECFSLVIDPGTLEHCFNVGQAFKSTAEAVALGAASSTTILRIGSAMASTA